MGYTVNVFQDNAQFVPLVRVIRTESTSRLPLLSAFLASISCFNATCSYFRTFSTNGTNHAKSRGNSYQKYEQIILIIFVFSL